jgi:hypothetical protein
MYMPPPQLRAPGARGPLSRWVLNRLTGSNEHAAAPVPHASHGLDDDLQLALYLCYESHYSDLPDVVVDREWDPAIVAFRRALEASFESALAALARSVAGSGATVREAIVDMIDSDDSPSLSRYMEQHGTIDEMREFVIHRSLYQRKEADPHTFAIPRLSGRAKRLLVEIQAGEYGADDEKHVMHSELFAQTMRALGLDDRLHAYLDVVPSSALMVSNVISLFGLNRRWRGALVGHLALFEATSVVPMSRYARALERMGAAPDARRFYEVHVLADGVHERMGLDMAESFAASDPALAASILFGARSAIAVDRLFAAHLLDRWDARSRDAAMAA